MFFAALIYSLLMCKEFFVSGWLRKHFTIYIISHEILILPLFFYIFSLNGLQGHHMSQVYFWLLTLFLGAQLFLLEVTRKIRPAELEIPSRDTYTAQYGVKGASLLGIFLGLMTILFGAFTEKMLYEKIPSLGCIPLLVFTVFLFLILRFVQKPSTLTAKKVFSASILFVLFTNLVFIANILISP
jgi:nitric oxide reductase large subunit